jgi:polar amino acid transport system permease protein
MLMFHYDWDWGTIWAYRYVLAKGLFVTLELTVISVLAGTLAGLALGLLLSSTSRALILIRVPLLLYIDVVKALPALLLLLLFYYWLPYLSGIQSPFWLAVITFTVNLSAFVADVFRHAISGVPKPLAEACYALGMTRPTAMSHVIVPEALRSILPTLGILAIEILKLTSIASIIAVPDLIHRASDVSTYTFRFLEMYAALAVIYLLVLVPFSHLVRRLEASAAFLRRS